MEHQQLEIGHPLKVKVYWYDKVPEPPENEGYDGEVVGWKESQIVVRVPGYSVIRIWKKNGLEVGNPDWKREGFGWTYPSLPNPSNPPTTRESRSIYQSILTLNMARAHTAMRSWKTHGSRRWAPRLMGKASGESKARTKGAAKGAARTRWKKERNKEFST